MASAVSQLESAPRRAVSAVRVLHVINGEEYAGAERVQDTLALTLPDYGYEVGFACLKPRQFAEARRSRQSPLYELPMRGKFDWSPVHRLAAVIHEGEYRLIHSHTPRTALIALPAARLAGVPLVHHIHCQTAVEVGRRRWQDRINLLVERLATYRAARVIAVSPSLHRYLLHRGYSRRQLRLATNGVPVRDPAPRRARRNQPPTVGMLALFRPRKGMEVLLRSLAILRDQGSTVRLRAVGHFQSVDYERQVKDLVSRENVEGLVEWIGFRSNIVAELARMDVLVLPSLVSEAMPMSVLEAMASGVVVVGTSVDGITDLIDDGVDGLLAQPGDAADLASAIRRATAGGDEIERLRAAALRKQRGSFSDRSMAAGVAEVYEEVLGP